MLFLKIAFGPYHLSAFDLYVYATGIRLEKLIRVNERDNNNLLGRPMKIPNQLLTIFLGLCISQHNTISIPLFLTNPLYDDPNGSELTTETFKRENS